MEWFQTLTDHSMILFWNVMIVIWPVYDSNKYIYGWILDSGLERKSLLKNGSLKRDLVDFPFENVVCLDKLAMQNAKSFVTMAGFASNLVTKGTMKAVGFIFKAIMEHVNGLSPTMAVIFPSLMHLFFNCFCKFFHFPQASCNILSHPNYIF